MKTCKNCSRAYSPGEWGDYTQCPIVDRTNNISLKLLGEEGNCPYWKEEIINNGWGAK